MRKPIIGLIVPLLFLAASSSSAFAQEQTERYIPIGYSPGISGKYAYLGEITAVDAANRTITVQSEAGSRTIRIVEQTRIWLDRSTLRQTSTPGTYGDLEVGLTVEIKYLDYQQKDAASWVKVAVR
jgi:hypothetical protein